MNCGGFVFVFRCSPRSVDPNRLGKSLRFWYSVDNRTGFFCHANSSVCGWRGFPWLVRSATMQASSSQFRCDNVRCCTSERTGDRIPMRLHGCQIVAGIPDDIHRFELAFGKRIVVGYMRTTVALVTPNEPSK